jgi:NADP-dependent 3-hydroxy acid dehydrogenase YdfG
MLDQTTIGNQAFDYQPETVDGKRVLVTGGTTGIGRTTALLLAARGARVMIFGRHKKELDDALKNMKQAGVQDRVLGLTADIAKPEGISKVFTHVDEQLGGLDILINNAGLPYASVMEGGYKDWEYILDTNLLGYLACAHEAAARMKKKRSGHIVNIGSMSAEERGKDSSVYVATKSGIQGFSESLGKELSPKGIKVTLIEPGSVGSDFPPKTPKVQRKREKELKMMKAEDIAVCVLYVLTQPRRCDVVSVQVRPHLDED